MEEGLVEGQDGHGNEVAAEGEFQFINTVIGDGIQKNKEVGINALTFDTHEELLWVGTRSGHVTSYYGTQLQKYTSFQVHPTGEVRNILTVDGHLLILTNSTLRCQLRRGIPLHTHTSSNLVDMHSLVVNGRSGRLLMGGMQEKLIDYDVDQGKEINVISSDEGSSNVILRDQGRFVCCGDAMHGKVVLRDPLSLKACHSLDAHAGMLSDFDVHGNHLVTCGQSIRHGMAQADRFLMVYDLRILRATSPLQTVVSPFQLRFLPSMSSSLVVLSSLGEVQILDLMNASAPSLLSLFQLNLMDSSSISMDIAPSNQCIAFGDTANVLHLYATSHHNQQPLLNPYARDTEFADHVEQLPPMSMEDTSAIYSSVPRPHLPSGDYRYLSDTWPEHLRRRYYRPTPMIPAELINSMKLVGTIGYAPNVTGLKRNQVNYPNVKSRSTLNIRRQGHGNTSEKADYRSALSSSDLQHYSSGGFGDDVSCCSSSGVPSRYKKVSYRLNKQGLVDEQELERYNRTTFSGLEASLPNSYCNTLLQMLFFTPHLRLLVLNHTCEREHCVACELSFLFHMMDTGRGTMCVASNLLRALRMIKEASALGLIFADSSAVWHSNVPRLVQSWLRFVVQQLNMLLEDSTSLFQRLFGVEQRKRNVCLKCQKESFAEDTIFMCNLVYPGKSNKDNYIAMEQIVASSLNPTTTTPAWCDTCNKYQATQQSRECTAPLPHVLALNLGMENEQHVDFWRQQMTHLLRQSQSKQREEKENYHQRHPGGLGHNTNVDVTEVDVGDQLVKLGLSYIPTQMTLHRFQDGRVLHGNHSLSNAEEKPTETTQYKLYAVCSAIREVSAKENEWLNIVAAVNVGPDYHTRNSASAVSQWYLLNDFSLQSISEDEATWVNMSWKQPCLLFYSSENEPEPLRSLVFKNPLTANVFLKDQNVSQKMSHQHLKPKLSEHELPKKGDLVAIDAEFVTLNQEEAELRSDGKVATVKAAHMSVARITCVKGSGPNTGATFIDDYISTQEQVVDYLTKFSGIKPGEKHPNHGSSDLDANFSSKHLTTLKSTYKKLRYLIDTGCIFIGHGLKSDFRVINVVVPPEQVVDTVHLFHLPHNRMVSLRFLAFHFLNGRRIQSGTHDSVEDAVTALELYKLYLSMKEKNEFVEALNNLYDEGRKRAWKVPDDE